MELDENSYMSTLKRIIFAVLWSGGVEIECDGVEIECDGETDHG